MSAPALHFHLVQSIVNCLQEIFSEQKYADKVIEKLFKQNRKWGARDRRFFAETVYEIVRHWRKLVYLAGSQDTWAVVGTYLFLQYKEIPDWEEFDSVNLQAIRQRLDAHMDDEVIHSFPDWLHQLGQKEFGAEWPALMRALNRPAEVFLRTNTLRTDRNTLIENLAVEDIEVEPVRSEKGVLDSDLPQALQMRKRKNVFVSQAFRKGFFEMQDAASQLVAPLLELQPGLRVADACAGAGGKSLHIAALMKNKGKIIAMDIHEWKLKELKTRAARAGVDIIETKLIESSKTIKRLENSFDRVLLDVPCSGLGVLRRNPDSKWKLSAAEIDRLVNLQSEILSQYSRMCKPGGILVYATCSILHRENEQQVENFLSGEGGAQWEQLKQLRVWPHKDGFDGFFAAVIRRKT